MHSKFPAAQIDYLTGHWSAPALKDNPYLNKVIEFNDEVIRRRNIPKLLTLAANVRRQKYDAILVLDPGWQAGLLATFFGSLRIGFNRNGEGRFHHQTIPFTETDHDSLQYLKVGELLRAKSSDTFLDLIHSTADKIFAQKFLSSITRPRIAVCPGGAKNPYQNMPERRWPADYYGKLIQQLQAKKYGVIVLAGKKMSLSQIAAVITECDLVVTHDQGLMHVAATTQTPTLVLFGPTDPRRKAPLGTQHKVIWHASEPCEQNGQLRHCTLAHDMRAISVAEVLTAIGGMLLDSSSISPAVSITSSTVIART